MSEQRYIGRREFLGLSAAVFGTVVLAGCAGSKATYPEKPVTMIVPFPPGGGMDTSARAIVEAIKPHFPQPITIVNRGGASGTVGTAEVVQSKPDGYTIGWTSNTITTFQPYRIDLPYKTPADFRAVANLVIQPYFLGVNASSPWKTLQEFLAYAKANPGKLRVGVSGIGTANHFHLEILKEKAGVDVTVVPFEGDGPAATQLLGGHIEGHMSAPAALVGHAKAGTVRLLAFFGEERAQAWPEVPTAKELGYDTGFVCRYFMIVPKGTPDEAVSTLDQAFKKVTEDPAFRQFVVDNVYLISYLSPADLQKQLEADYKMFGELIKKLKL